MSITITVDGVDYEVPSSASDTNWAANQVAWEQAITTYATSTATDLAELTAAFTPAWTSLTSLLSNSWAQLAGGYQTAGYWKDGAGIVHLRGSIKDGTSGTVAFTLPSGLRPSATVVLVASADGGQAEISVATSGAVTITATDAADVTARTSLDGLSFSTSA